MKRVVARLAAGLVTLVVFAVTAGTALASGPVTVSQVYGGGGNSGATIKQDYIQLYNRGAASVNVTGWTVQYASTAGSSWQKTTLAGTIAPGGSYLIQEAQGAGGTVDLASPDASGTIAMSGTAGKVALVSDATTLAGTCPVGGAIVDFVGYGSATNCSETAPTANLSNTTAALRKADGAQDTDSNLADFTIGAPDPKGGTGGGGGGGGATPLKIDEIQGASQVSPFLNSNVSTTGIVTAVVGNGFYLQDPQPDADAATSEGIFVFQNGPAVAVGDGVRVNGRVAEFIPGGTSTGNLPTTELSGSVFTLVLSSGNPLPAPVVAHPPTQVIEDDSAPDVRNGNTFDPAEDGLDYWESLEGMRVQVNGPVAVGPQNSFGELPVIGSDFGAGLRTARGGLLLTATDGNPERIILDDQILQTPPVANVGDTFDGPAIGVMNYNFGNFMLELTQSLTRIDGGLQREVTGPAGPLDLSVATFNVENLDLGDGAAKFDGLANRIVANLRSPKIVALEEVQDNTGPTDDGTVESNLVLDRLVQAITAAGGPAYSYTYIAPVNDQDGGEPGGNIRIAFLYDTAAGVSLPDGAVKGGSTDAESIVVDAAGKPHLALDPGRIDPTDGAWSSSRKPLAGEFVFRGATFFVIGNHFNSKGGDNPLMGRFQPPVQSSTVQRHQQAQIVHDFVAELLSHDASANVVVLGDLNDFQFSDTVHILEGGATPVLFDMIDTLPANEQYSYEFEGNAQVLDHILASDAIATGTRTFDVVHINAEFSDQLSDHDPSVLKVALPVTVERLCGLVGEWAKNAGQANSLCVKLRAGQIAAFGHEVDAQTGKAFTADQAATLKQLAAQIQ